jgi:hypothetical protein
MRWYIGKERDRERASSPTGAFAQAQVALHPLPWEWPDFIQGAILCVVPMGVIAGMQQAFGISYEVGLTMSL